jgi:hypothetical protein
MHMSQLRLVFRRVNALIDVAVTERLTEQISERLSKRLLRRVSIFLSNDFITCRANLIADFAVINCAFERSIGRLGTVWDRSACWTVLEGWPLPGDVATGAARSISACSDDLSAEVRDVIHSVGRSDYALSNDTTFRIKGNITNVDFFDSVVVTTQNDDDEGKIGLITDDFIRTELIRTNDFYFYFFSNFW